MQNDRAAIVDWEAAHADHGGLSAASHKAVRALAATRATGRPSGRGRQAISQGLGGGNGMAAGAGGPAAPLLTGGGRFALNSGRGRETSLSPGRHRPEPAHCAGRPRHSPDAPANRLPDGADGTVAREGRPQRTAAQGGRSSHRGPPADIRQMNCRLTHRQQGQAGADHGYSLIVLVGFVAGIIARLLAPGPTKPPVSS